MIGEAILSWALIITYGAYGLDIVYFENKLLCENAKNIIQNTKSNGTYANTSCLQIREEKNR